MTKARDLANASTALSAVSAAELAFLDGVTSAVQTQIDGKIAQATAVNPTIIDAKGDIITATAADTPARLAVGANGEILVADSSQATGLKYQAPTVNTVIDAKGDILAGTAADTIARLAVGANTYLLTADSAEATGMKWAAAAGGFGTITAYTPTWTGITIGNGSFQDVGYSASGDLVWYFGQFLCGSTTAYTAQFKLSLPVNGLGRSANLDGRQLAQTFGGIGDTSTGYIYNYAITMENASPATKFNMTSLFTNGTYISNQTQGIQQTVPITFADGDVIGWNFFYRKA